MNAQELEFVTCPACRGAKKVLSRQGDKEVPCIHCQAHGDVEASRVCPDCGHWRHSGPCARQPLKRADDAASSPANGKPLTSVKDKLPTGVNWNEQYQVYQVNIYREGKTHYLGIFKDLDLAAGIRQEAERVPVSEYPALKASYANLKKERRAATKVAPGATTMPTAATDDPTPGDVAQADAATPPSPWAAPASPLTFSQGQGASLTELLADAQKADARAVLLKGCLQEAREKYEWAEEQAIQAWNAYADALKSAVGSSDPFARSAMGALLDDRGYGQAEES